MRGSLRFSDLQLADVSHCTPIAFGESYEFIVDFGRGAQGRSSVRVADPAASMTARISSIRSSSVAALVTRSDKPVPRLWKRVSRQKDVRR